MLEENAEQFEVILGTYEQFLLGYKFSKGKKKGSLKQSFATHDHTASIRSVALGTRFVASGGADDRIFVYDMIARREQTVLTHHNGTVNCVEFTPDGSHLLTASEDGQLYAIRTGNWQTEKIWTKAHGGTAVRAIAVHPSSKLALTVGNDATLRTWNLVKGRQAYIIRLETHLRNANSLCWSSDETSFLIFATKHLELWDVAKGGCLEKLTRSISISSVCWFKDNIIVGHETGSLAVLDRKLNEITENSDVHKTRIKCLSSFAEKWIVSADSSGLIVVWKLKKKKLIKICDICADCRITCMCLMKPLALKKENDAVDVENDVEVSSGDDEIVSNINVAKRTRDSYVVEEREQSDDEDVKAKKVKKQKEKLVKKKKKKNKNKK